MSDRPPVDELESLERALAGRTLGPSHVEERIHQDFVEFGTSGRFWTRDEVVMSLVNEPPSPVDVVDLEVASPVENVALVTYRSVSRDDAPALRSSIWVLEGGRWQMRFHQGTRLPREPRKA